MSDEIGDDELDGILDGALEAFESPPKPKAKGTPSDQASDVSAPALELSDEPKTPEDIGPELKDEAARAFDDALKALGDLNVNAPQDGDGEEVNDADMKMVEEFMASLGSSLGGLGAPGAGGDGTREVPAGEGEPGPGGVPGAGLGADGVVPNMEKLVESIVGHLVSEDVLKSPMLQMRAAYAEWLPKHAEELSEEELGRYGKQQELVEEICKRYENGADSGTIMELLSKMQETGSPPADVMKGLSGEGENGDMAGLPGMAPPELDKMVESCGMQ